MVIRTPTSMHSAAPFVGRIAELEELRAVLPSVTEGRGHMVTIAGEPGIGKTRLMSELGKYAESTGNLVLWSQMTEGPGAPPYFCWRLALRSCIQQSDADNLIADMGSGASDVATIVPEMHEQFDIEQTTVPPNSTTARYQLFDSITRFLLRRAARKPVLLLLDNLHAADRSSLALLEYLSQHIARAPLLVIGAYRDSELDRRHPLRATLNALGQSAGYLRLVLAGLSREDTARLLHSRLGAIPPAVLLNSLHEQSDGNPLFVTEVGNMLARKPVPLLSGAGYHFEVPQSLRDVIGIRLDALSADTIRVLRHAAVLGRDFDVLSLAELASMSPRRAARLLLQAETTGIVAAQTPGRYRFVHVLYRETLYTEQKSLSRILLHQRAAEQLEHRYRDDLDPHLSSLAYHYFEAVQVGGESKAIYYCWRAADAAVTQRAYGEAVALLDCALQAGELAEKKNNGERFSLLLAMGRAEYQSGQLTAATRTLMRAAVLAYRRQLWESLAEALYLFQLVCQQSGSSHVAAVPLHKAVLEHLPAENGALRARVLASLAKAYRTAAEPKLAEAAFRQSVVLARQCNDTDVLLDCLTKGNWTVGRSPLNVSEGLAISREALALATAQKNTAAVLDCVVDIIFQLCDLGEIDEVERQLTVLATLAKKERQPHFRNVLIGFETAVAILRGNWADALQSAQVGVRQNSLQNVRGLQGRFAFQVFAVRKAQGSLGELQGVANEIIAQSTESTMWLPGQIILYCEMGDMGKARSALQRLGNLKDLPNDDLLEVALIYMAESCIKLADQQRCAELLRLLTPYRGKNVTLPGTFMIGAVSGFLAMLAAATRRVDEARELFDEALAMNMSMGALPELARTRVEYARMLLRSDRQVDRLKAGKLIAEARPVAEALGLRPVITMINDLAINSGADSLTIREIDVLRTIAKGLSNNGIAEALNISHSTVTTHVRSIFRKTSVANRTEAADFARRTGLLDHE